MAEEDRIIISKNCFLFPIANTDVEMAVEYRKAANGNLRIYNNGPIAPKLMTGNYNWKEQRKEGCDREEHHNGIDITAKDPSNVATNTYDLIAVADGTVIATSEKNLPFVFWISLTISFFCVSYIFTIRLFQYPVDVH